MKNQKAANALQKTRIDLISWQPFWGVLAMRLKYVERLDIPTLATDGVHVFYNPDFVLELPPKQRETGLAHEISHCIQQHILRRGSRNAMKWNWAIDYCVNGGLKNAGFEPLPFWLYKEGWDFGTSAEKIYDELPDPPPMYVSAAGGSGKGDKDQKDMGPNGDGHGAFDQVIDADVIERPDLAESWHAAVAQAAMTAKQAGKLPADLEKFLKDITEPKEDWRTRLRRFFTEQTKSDYMWGRPHKLFALTGVCLPVLDGHQMGTMVAVIDDSGSTWDIIDAFGQEIVSARNSARPQRTILINCDADIGKVQDMDEYEPLSVDQIKVIGGGGTDFRPPFKWIEEQGIKPAALLYLTDGYGPFPDVAPDYPVLWCITTDVEPPWGEHVRIDAA